MITDIDEAELRRLTGASDRCAWRMYSSADNCRTLHTCDQLREHMAHDEPHTDEFDSHPFTPESTLDALKRWIRETAEVIARADLATAARTAALEKICLTDEGRDKAAEEISYLPRYGMTAEQITAIIDKYRGT